MPDHGMTVAIATCSSAPERATDDDRALVAALLARGAAARIVAWDEPSHDWSGYELVVIRSTWDYTPRRAEFVEWARSVPHLANPSRVIEWNTDKTYLRELAAAGVPIVPTVWSAAGLRAEVPAVWPDYVVKPAISAGAADTNRYAEGDEEKAAAHLDRLAKAGRLAMIQPYMAGVDAAGETAMIFINGEFSHAMRKGPLLALGADALTPDTYTELMETRAPSEAELRLARQVLKVIPEKLLYARIDVLPGPDGQPVLIEAELTEPYLFLSYADGAVDLLAAAILEAATA